MTAVAPAAQQSKRDRILDAAEVLFAAKGFDGVTLREIASAARVDVALANYHFGKKDDLFVAVFGRRAKELNARRLEALAKAEADASPEPASVEAVIGAFLRPLEIAQRESDDNWHHYLALIAYVNNSPYWGQRLMSDTFDELVSRFIEVLGRALPNASPDQLYWCYHNLSGALTLTFARTGRIDRLSDGLCRSDDYKSAYDNMIPFMAAGFHATCSGE